MEIARNRSYKYCQSRQCSALLQIKNNNPHSRREDNGNPGCIKQAINVVCPECKAYFCFKCDLLAHWPASCSNAEWFSREAEQYFRKVRSDYYVAQVKKCPKCNIPFEKGEGCDQIICRCSYSFCWRCLQEMKGHYNDGIWKCKPLWAEVPVLVSKLTNSN